MVPRSGSSICISPYLAVSPNFTVSSGEIAVGNPLGDFARVAITSRNPGTFRLAANALVRVDDASDGGVQLNDELIYAWDLVFTDTLAKALRQHQEHCAGDVAVMAKRSWKLKSLTGTRIACYRTDYACTDAPPGRYRLDATKVVRSSAWRLGVRETAGKLNFGRIAWNFSLGFLSAGFLCLLGLLFGIAAIGCTVQHFVDPDAVWNRDPTRGVVEPLTLAAMSVLAWGAGICLYRRKPLWAIGMIVLIGMIGTAGTS